jgi:hypothetical protein
MLSRLYKMGGFKSKRSSSWDRSGGNKDWAAIPPGKTLTLMEEGGAGYVRHFYWTYIEAKERVRLNIFRGLVLRAYWDGAAEPSVEVPLGDFFGVCNGQVRPIRSLAFVTNPGFDRAGRVTWGFNCYLPMPFETGAKLEVENQGDQEARIWFHIDYELHDGIDEPIGRLHALWSREWDTEAVQPPAIGEEIKNLSGEENYTILDVRGDGQFAGFFLTVVNSERGWWGEGDDMIFLDGESFPPSIHGTGTEEIFGGGASPATEYSGPYTGFHCIENRGGYDFWGTNGMYRFYITDPIRFRKQIRVSLEHGHGNDKSNDYCSTAFWYQPTPNTGLPPLADLKDRRINFQS